MGGCSGGGALYRVEIVIGASVVVDVVVVVVLRMVVEDSLKNELELENLFSLGSITLMSGLYKNKGHLEILKKGV